MPRTLPRTPSRTSSSVDGVFHLTFVRPISDGELRAEGTVIEATPAIVFAEAVARDADGRDVGRGSGVFARQQDQTGPELGYADEFVEVHLPHRAALNLAARRHRDRSRGDDVDVADDETCFFATLCAPRSSALRRVRCRRDARTPPSRTAAASRLGILDAECRDAAAAHAIDFRGRPFDLRGMMVLAGEDDQLLAAAGDEELSVSRNPRSPVPKARTRAGGRRDRNSRRRATVRRCDLAHRSLRQRARRAHRESSPHPLGRTSARDELQRIVVIARRGPSPLARARRG